MSEFKTALIFLSPKEHLMGLDCLLNSIEINSPRLHYLERVLLSEDIISYPRVNKIVKIDESLFKNMKSTISRFQRIYPKLMMFTKEFQDYDRMIYIDTDMLCLSDLSFLLSDSISQYDILAVRNNGIKLAMKYRNHHITFNAGMYVVNKNFFSKTSFDEIKKIAEQEYWEEADQSVLNELIYQNQNIEFGWLSTKFNTLKRLIVHHPNMWANVKDNIALLHYCGFKPWYGNKLSLLNDKHVESNLAYNELEQLWWQYFNCNPNVINSNDSKE